MNEEPESLPERLPDWFLKALGHLGNGAEEQAARRARAAAKRNKKVG